MSVDGTSRNTDNPKLGPKAGQQWVQKSGRKVDQNQGPKSYLVQNLQQNHINGTLSDLDQDRAKPDNKAPVTILIDKASDTNFDNPESKEELRAVFDDLCDTDDLHLGQLAKLSPVPSSFWDHGNGQALLGWILETDDLQQEFRQFVRGRKKPLSIAIEEKNTAFLRCFLRLCKNNESLGASSILADEYIERTNGNFLHAVTEYLPQCAVEMTEVCTVDALQQPDRNDETPFHLAMRSPRAQAGESNSGDLDVRKFLDAIEKRDNIENKIAAENKDAMENRYTIGARERLPSDDTKPGKLLSELLLRTNNKGISPYLERKAYYNLAKTGRGNLRAWVEEKKFQARLESLVLNAFSVTNIRDIGRALFGKHGKTPSDGACVSCVCLASRRQLYDRANIPAPQDLVSNIRASRSSLGAMLTLPLSPNKTRTCVWICRISTSPLTTSGTLCIASREWTPEKTRKKLAIWKPWLAIRQSFTRRSSSSTSRISTIYASRARTRESARYSGGFATTKTFRGSRRLRSQTTRHVP